MYYRLYSILLALSVTVLTIGCKKNENNPGDNNPACDTKHSRVIEERVVTKQGNHIASYSYDDQNRISRISYKNDTTVIPDVIYSYYGDSLIITQWKDYTGYYTFNTEGRQIKTLQKWANGDSINFFYYYNSIGEVITTSTYVKKNDGHGTSWEKDDSLIYTWQDGNMVKLTSLNNYYSTYEYLPNTDGWYNLNAPYQTSRWIYVSFAKPVVSRNFLKKVTYYNQGVISGTYDNSISFDASDRPKLIKMTYSDKDTVETNTTYKYKCL